MGPIGVRIEPGRTAHWGPHAKHASRLMLLDCAAGLCSLLLLLLSHNCHLFYMMLMTACMQFKLCRCAAIGCNAKRPALKRVGGKWDGSGVHACASKGVGRRSIAA